MNKTTISSTLDWRGNNKGVWKALVKDMTPDSAVTFVNGYTAIVSGRTVSVTNATAPVGAMTYDSELTNAVNTAPLYGAGTAYDSLEAVAGDKTVRMGSVDLGSLTWTFSASSDYGLWSSTGIAESIAKPASANVAANVLASNYDNTYRNNLSGAAGKVGLLAIGAAGNISVNNGSTTVSPTGMLYYELAEPTTSTETPQSLSLTTGDDTLSGGFFDTTYEGTDYAIPLIRNCKYLHRSPDGTESLVTGSTTNTSINVKGGESKLVNLTHWFGRNREPSIEDFYKLYPTWKNYDIPYNQGSVLNYKGTGVETIGFNAYNHSTGTAALLGGNKYQICGTFTSVSYVDIFGESETITLDSANCFTPVNDGTLTVTGGNGTDTCVHLVWSGYKNYGEPEYKWEPFTRNVKELPISTYFPDGMNSVRDVRDELTSEQTIQRIGVIDLGTLTYNDYTNTQNTTYPYGYVSFTLSGKAGGKVNIISTRYVTSVADGFVLDKSMLGTDGSTTCYIIDSDFIGMTGAQIKAALSGVLCYYELATPVVTQIDQPLNLAYPVNDFGTEHSLPQNTTTLVTTDLKALIRYNTDYMRMNSQLSGIFPTVKSLVQQEQDGYIMKKDDTAPNAIVGGAYNLIDRNAEGTERQFSFDTSGGTQDITDGTAVAKKSMGTTLNLNQLVHDTNQNTVTGEGQVEVEDAVVSDVASLVVSGRSLVKNQLVSPTTERTVNSSDGVIAVNDGIVETPKGLVLTAPRSVVVNQLLNYRDVSTTQNGVTITSNGDGTYTVSTDAEGATATTDLLVAQLSNGVPLLAGHTYLLTGAPSGSTDTSYYITDSYSGWYVAGATSNKHTRSATGVGYWKATIRVVAGTIITTPVTFAPQIVDLTQYFNGDSALIDSITSWDDLVAYDPRFASYVEYNTGTVTGVTPSVGVNAYMRNQKARAQNTSSSPSSGISTVSKTDRDMSFALTSTNPSSYITIAGGSLIVGHRYIVTGYATCSYTATFRGLYQTIATVQTQVIPANTRTRFFLASTVNTSRVDFVLYVNVDGTGVSGDTIQIEDLQLIDVTQLRYGYIVPTIVNWDDLIAIVPEYANYVAYDTGTVVGTVATSPQELFAVGTAADNFEAVTGKLTHKMGVVDLGTLDWTAYSAQSVTETYPNGQTSCTLAGKKSGITNLITAKYISRYTLTVDKSIYGYSSNNLLRLIDSSLIGKTAQEVQQALSGIYLYYELANPTEELLTSSIISLQQGSNVALQTDGGRTAPFSLTYDGTEFTLPLDSTHKYAYSDNGTKSVITGSSEQAVTGGQDMLVDVTRMFNGDSTAINAITSWADMAAVMPEYNSTVAYNEGEVVARSGNVVTTSGDTATFTGLHGIGLVKDTQDVVTGEKGVKIGSVDLGTLNWSYSNGLFSANIVGAVTGTSEASAPMICGILTKVDSISSASPDWCGKLGASSTLYIRYSGTTNATTFKSLVSSITCYYELATPSTTSETPQSLTFSAGLNNVHEEDVNITSTPINMEYTGTDYTIATKSARKYIKTIDGTTELVTGVSSVDVRGGRDNLIDLTRMFGSGLEPGTLDAFYSLFPAWNGYRLPYNKGSLLNFKGTGLKSVGFNLVDFGGRTLGAPQNTTYSNTTVRGPFDETKYYVGFSSNNYYLPSNVSSYEISESSITLKTNPGSYGVAFPIRVIPGQIYRCENAYSGNRALSFYTYNGTYISSSDTTSNQVAAPANAYWGLLNVTTLTANTTYTWTNPCVHLQWSGTRNGDYEPYWDYVRPIPTLTYFPDGMNGRGSVYDEINPRQAVKRFGKVDLGTLTWTWLSSVDYGYWRSTVIADAARPSGVSVVANIIGELYAPVNVSGLSGAADKVGLIGLGPDGALLVNTGSTTESPTGWLVYELATPVVTTFPEEISATARISDYGTEECLPVNGYVPTTAPFRGIVLYQDDYARTITKLPENYISKESMEAFLTMVGPLLNGEVTMTYNQSTGQYTFNYTAN